jgi:hypothetical protein
MTVSLNSSGPDSEYRSVPGLLSIVIEFGTRLDMRLKQFDDQQLAFHPRTASRVGTHPATTF